MKLSLSARLARACARRPWRTIGLWVVLLALAIVVSGAVGSKFDNNGDFTNNPESKQGQELINSRFQGDQHATETIVITSPSRTVDDPVFRQVVEQTAANVKGLTGVVASASTYYDLTASGSPQAASLVAKDRHTTIIPVTMTNTEEHFSDNVKQQYLDTAVKEQGNGIGVYTAGDLSGNLVYNQIANQDLSKDLRTGVPIALVILVFVFGALVAAGVPVLLGLISIAIATGLTGILTHVLNLNSDVTIMISLVGLAVGIDYALFVIERYREERRHGRSRDDALTMAASTAGKAVLFSGCTVVFALLGMFIIPVTVFHSLGLGAIMVVLIAVAATQTLLPALIRLLGNKLDWPRRHRYDAAAIAKQAVYDRETIHKGVWGRVTRLVMNHARGTFLAGIILLLLVAAPLVTIKTGQAGIDSLPPSSVTTAQKILLRDFYAGATSPVQIVVDGPVTSPEIQRGVTNLVDALKADDMYGLASIRHNDAGNLTVVEAPLKVDPDSRAAYSAVDTLRHTTVPQAFGSEAAHVYVTGESASIVDTNAVLATDMPLIFAFVLGLSFLLLLLAFRSVVVPLTAICMNLLSVGAAYGVLVAVFQHGIGANLLGVHQTAVITSWIPIFLFCILFGLSMDYHVFLLSRIREHYDATRNNDESVAAGLQSTGKIITGAALIMVAVFAAFATGRLVEIQEVGLGLAVAIFLDATVVRSLLVPATMKLLGDRNWYLPRVLRWLPDLRIDHAPAAAPVPAPTRREPVGQTAAD